MMLSRVVGCFSQWLYREKTLCRIIIIIVLEPVSLQVYFLALLLERLLLLFCNNNKKRRVSNTQSTTKLTQNLLVLQEPTSLLFSCSFTFSVTEVITSSALHRMEYSGWSCSVNFISSCIIM